MAFPSLILFDCDGTLVDSEYLNNLAVLETLKSFGIQDFDMDYALEHFVGLRFSRIVAMVAEMTKTKLPEDAAKHYLKKVAELSQLHLKEITGARETVQAVSPLAKICVVSNGEHNNVLSSLDTVTLREFFTDAHIFTGLMASNPKPAPDLFLLAAREMGVAPEHSLVIEDSAAGVSAGIAAGMTVWGFCGTHHRPEAHIKTLEALGAQNVYRSMADMKAALLSLF